MAYNQSFQPVKSELINSTSSANLITSNNSVSQKSSRYGELSSSGVESDWVVFSPDIEDEEEYEGDDDSDMQEDGEISKEAEIVLSTANEYDDNKEEEDTDEEDSLIDSLEANQGLKLSLPTHDGSGNFINSFGDINEDHAAIFNNNLSKEDFITNRIDSWRREQARVLTEELQQNPATSSTGSTTRGPSPSTDLLASWGVDDRDPIESKLDNEEVPKVSDGYNAQKKQNYVESKPYKHGSKRFYGDYIFEKYSEWEVSMIKKVANELSTSLVRDRRNDSIDYRTGIRSKRSSLLSNLSKNAINNYIMGSGNSFFWKKDLSSAHSSISTNSIMFGNSWGDVA